MRVSLKNWSWTASHCDPLGDAENVNYLKNVVGWYITGTVNYSPSPHERADPPPHPLERAARHSANSTLQIIFTSHFLEKYIKRPKQRTRGWRRERGRGHGSLSQHKDCVVAKKRTNVVKTREVPTGEKRFRVWWVVIREKLYSLG